MSGAVQGETFTVAVTLSAELAQVRAELDALPDATAVTPSRPSH